MKKMTMEDLRKRITYHQEGDFMVPDIGLPEEEEDEPPPNRPLHQSPPVVLSLGASGSGAGSGPALTTMFTRPFSFAVAPAAGS